MGRTPSGVIGLRRRVPHISIFSRRLGAQVFALRGGIVPTCSRLHFVQNDTISTVFSIPVA